jgi:hypothetical protein
MVEHTKMEKVSSYHQLGKFIAYFQMAEREINGIMQLLCKGTDEEMVQILINDLEYSRRLDTADVLFSKFVDTYQDSESIVKTKFHKLIVKLKKLGQRRNDLVHSNYIPWYNVEGFKGLIRENSKLRGSKGFLEKIEEKLLPETLNAELEQIEIIFNELNEFRLQTINWRYPEENDV